MEQFSKYLKNKLKTSMYAKDFPQPQFLQETKATSLLARDDFSPTTSYGFLIHFGIFYFLSVYLPKLHLL